VLEHFAPAAQLGMTATPLRNDNIDTYRYFGDPLYEYSLHEGIDDGFLAPYRVRRVVLSPDAHGWAPDTGQLDMFGREIPDGLYTTSDFERVVSLLARTDAAARHLTAYLQRTDPMAKTIVFCVDSEHAAQMRQALVNANADLVRQYPDYVVRIVSAEGEIGGQHLGALADPESATPVIATTSKLLSTGVDMPTVRNVVLFKPIGSMVDFKQIIGRGTRLYPDADKLTFEIIDYSGATRLFEDPEFDGPPERLVEEEIDANGNVIDVPMVAEPEPQWGETEEDEDNDTEELEERAERKFYVNDGEAFVTAEGYYLPDPETGRHRLVEYADFAADTVRHLFADPTELRGRWRTEDGRDAVLDTLVRHEVDIVELARRLGLEDADPLDLLVHLAWQDPLRTRRERARSVRTDHRGFLDGFRPEARAILEELLEKYAQHGPSELDLEVLEVPPLSGYGTPLEIAEHFGGPEQLREAVDRLQDLLYAA
jgi:type I restriction enzyme R subunit